MSEVRKIWGVDDNFEQGPVQVRSALAKVTQKQAKIVKMAQTNAAFHYRTTFPIERVHFTKEAAIEAWRQGLQKEIEFLEHKLARLRVLKEAEIEVIDEEEDP